MAIEVKFTHKISNQLIEVEYDNGDKEIINVIPINTRVQAIELCYELTKKALRRKDSFDKLESFKNDFSYTRNYEIENYLERISGILGYRIVELCPFNGFSFFK